MVNILTNVEAISLFTAEVLELILLTTALTAFTFTVIISQYIQ